MSLAGSLWLMLKTKLLGPQTQTKDVILLLGHAMPLLSYAWAILSFQQGNLAVLAVRSASIPAQRICLSKHAACLSLLCSQQPLGVSNLPALPANLVPHTPSFLTPPVSF